MTVLLKILRFIMHKLSSFGLTFAVIGFVSVSIFLATIGNRQTVLSWPRDAETYQQIPDVLFDLLEEQARSSESTGEVAQEILENGILDLDKLRAITRDSYDSEFLQTQAETGAHGIFDWVEGNTQQPAFTLSLAERAPAFVSELRTELVSQLNALPGCEDTLSAENSFMIFTATCIPAGVSTSAEIDNFLDQIANLDAEQTSNDKVLTGEYTGADLTESMSEDVKKLPEYYGLAKTARVLLVVVIIGLACIVVLTAKHHYKGLKGVGAIAISSAFSLFVSAAFLRLGDAVRQELYSSQGDRSLEILATGVIEPLTKVIADTVFKQLITWAIGLIVVGLAIWGAGFWWGHSQKKSATDSADQKTAEGQIADELDQVSVASSSPKDGSDSPSAVAAEHSAGRSPTTPPSSDAAPVATDTERTSQNQ